MLHHSSPEPVPDQKRSCISKQYSITFTSDSSERSSQKHHLFTFSCAVSHCRGAHAQTRHCQSAAPWSKFEGETNSHKSIRLHKHEMNCT